MAAPGQSPRQRCFRRQRANRLDEKLSKKMTRHEQYSARLTALMNAGCGVRSLPNCLLGRVATFTFGPMDASQFGSLLTTGTALGNNAGCLSLWSGPCSVERTTGAFRKPLNHRVKFTQSAYQLFARSTVSLRLQANIIMTRYLGKTAYSPCKAVVSTKS